MTTKPVKSFKCLSVRPSVCPSVRCQHFQNYKATRLLGRGRWNLACIFYGSADKTFTKRNFEFRSLCRAGPPRTQSGRERWEMTHPERSAYYKNSSSACIFTLPNQLVTQRTIEVAYVITLSLFSTNRLIRHWCTHRRDYKGIQRQHGYSGCVDRLMNADQSSVLPPYRSDIFNLNDAGDAEQLWARCGLSLRRPAA